MTVFQKEIHNPFFHPAFWSRGDGFISNPKIDTENRWNPGIFFGATTISKYHLHHPEITLFEILGILFGVAIPLISDMPIENGDFP